MTREFDPDDFTANQWTEPDHHSECAAKLLAEIQDKGKCIHGCGSECIECDECPRGLQAPKRTVMSDVPRIIESSDPRLAERLNLAHAEAQETRKKDRLFFYLRGFKHGVSGLSKPPKLEGNEDYERGYLAGARSFSHADKKERALLGLPERSILR